MIRRYFAVALIVIFFAYAGYLIVTDGGKSGEIITFSKINSNIHKKFMILTGQQKAEPTPDEIARINELKILEEAEKAAALLAATAAAAAAAGGAGGAGGSGGA